MKVTNNSGEAIKFNAGDVIGMRDGRLTVNGQLLPEGVKVEMWADANEKIHDTHDAVHDWFSLSYAAYLVLPRSVLQSMPDEWQNKFIALVEEVGEVLEVDDMPNYRVTAVDAANKFIKDDYRDYERGRRRIAKKGKI